MKVRIFLCLLIISAKCFSQEKVVTGIVFDKESKDRIASVSVRNTTTGLSVYNNLKGEFKINAQAGDQLVFVRQEYHSDTIKVQSNISLAIYMTRLAIQLKEVTVHDTLQDPDKRLEATKQDFTKIYGSLAYRDFLSTPSSGGAGLSIDAIFNSLSRSGRNAERLQQIIERDYQQNVIDYRFNRTFVGNITGLKGEKLTSFMFRYRPGYYIAKTASDYEFISMIHNNLRRFLKNSRTYSLPPLKSK
ncbi:MAG: hypothetical protein JWQ63_367 [Mucilaginibacter sp.]|nr:hypothetical protein [Mucilaginibacter sp.]